MTKRATKAELRREIADLRMVGCQMSNVCFNLGQHAQMGGSGRRVSCHYLASMKDLQQQWDAIRRAGNALSARIAEERTK